MKQKTVKIRSSLFETNSSSSHSVTISDITSDTFLDNSLYPNPDGNIILTGGEFGWGWERYNYALDKANYLAVYSRDNTEYRDMLIKVLAEQTKAVNIEFDLGDDSYIDHQSDYSEDGDANKCFESETVLRNFIFNKNSWLFTGNDNSTAPPNFYDVDTTVKFNWMFTLGKYALKLKSIPSNNEEWSKALNPILERYIDDLNTVEIFPGVRSRNFTTPEWGNDSFRNIIGLDGNRYNCYSKVFENKILLYKKPDVFTSDETKCEIMEVPFELNPIKGFIYTDFDVL